MKSIERPLSARQSWWLLVTGIVTFAPLLPHLPVWLSSAIILAFGWRALLVRQRAQTPPLWLLVTLGLGGCIALFAEYRTIFGQNPGVALLALLFALKQHEARSYRDGMTIVLLSYFLILTSFFYSQAIPGALLMLAAVTTVTAAMGSLADDRQTAFYLLRQTGLMLAQATPFLLILFVLFPRVSGPLWGLPRDAHSALSGLSDSMTPGSIGNLSLSDAIAFRVKFAGEIPARQQLYWRGPVLTQFDGHTWRPLHSSLRTQLPYVADTEGIGYEITLEPHNKPWLFALELPTHMLPESVATRDYQLLAKRPVVERFRYELHSQPGLAVGNNESRRLLDAARALPAGSNPRTLALGASWRNQSEDDEAILRAAASFFLRQQLLYTLTPPLLGRDDIDEFLFDTRKGFCEHFSGAFVFALRAAGIPARVVTGYQGGELNPVDGYLTVRQSDAHAWAEVWLRKQGWVRLDPTAISMPMRIDLNLAAALPAGDPLPALLRADLAWLREWRFRSDAVANAWNQWILGYNPQRQHDFLTRLGMEKPDWWRMTSALTLLCGIAMLALTLWAIWQRRHLDPAQRLWLRLTKRLARGGLPRPPWEGPRDYAIRIAKARPELAEDIEAIATLYIAIRYANRNDELHALRQRIAAFRP